MDVAKLLVGRSKSQQRLQQKRRPLCHSRSSAMNRCSKTCRWFQHTATLVPARGHHGCSFAGGRFQHGSIRACSFSSGRFQHAVALVPARDHHGHNMQHPAALELATPSWCGHGHGRQSPRRSTADKRMQLRQAVVAAPAHPKSELQRAVVKLDLEDDLGVRSLKRRRR